MNDNPAEALLEEKLRAALGSAKPPDFDGWLSQHKAAVAYLNPVTTARLQRNRKLLSWAGRALLALAACALVAIFWKNGGEQASFAQAIKTAQDAHTVTFRQSHYTRYFSKDGQRTWLKEEPPSSLAYRHPGHYRYTEYDPQGNSQWAEIVDLNTNKTLQLDFKAKKAIWANHSRNDYGPNGPISSSTKFLEHANDIQLIGQRKVGDAAANVFRRRLSGDNSDWCFDYWIDTSTKQLIGLSNFRGDADPTMAADRNNPPEKTFSHGEVGGVIIDNIVMDAKLDDALFEMTVPEGFEVIVEPPKPIVSEAEMIEFLGANARFNDGTFPDTARGVDLKKVNAAENKKKSDRTEIENKLIELTYKHINNHNGVPVYCFADDNTVPKTFRYIGKGIKLGDADRIVCWYKLKATGKWRAVYGDLSIKDVDPKDLPLSVE